MISPQELQARAAQPVNPEATRPTVDTYDGQGLLGRKAGTLAVSLAALASVVGIANRGTSTVRGPEAVAAAQLAPTSVSEATLPDVLGGISADAEFASFPVNENTRRSIGELAPGFAPEDLAFGSDIDMSIHTATRGATAFSQEGAYDGEGLAAFLTSGTPEAEAVKQHILSNENFTDEEKEAKLAGKGFLVMQVKKPAVVHGTTYYVDGEIRRANKRTVPTGDIYLLSLNPDGTIDKESSHRADCINPKIDMITPPEEGETPPTVTIPPSTTETPPTSTTVPESSTSSTSTSTSTSTTVPESTTTTTLGDKEDDDETPGPDDSPTPTTQPAPEGPATPDDGSENPVGGTSTTTTAAPNTSTSTTVANGPTTTAPQSTQPTTPRG